MGTREMVGGKAGLAYVVDIQAGSRVQKGLQGGYEISSNSSEVTNSIAVSGLVI
jgi:hypothetical protein